MVFNNPMYVFIGILGAIIWLLTQLNIGKKPELYVTNNLIKKKSGGLKFIHIFLGLFFWGSISYSLMGPRLPMGFSKGQIEVNDIFFVVDVSRSMLANDFDPNRLEAAKSKILEFIKLRPTDRIGIIIFSEKAFTLLPLTTDLDLISQIIGEIQVGFLGSGTNIGDALGLAIGRAAQSVAKNKVAVLLTDGVSNVGMMTPIQAAEKAKDVGLKVYTIGVGGSDTAQIPTGVNLFGQAQYQNIPGGSVDLKTLKQIADITGGKTYLATNDKALRDVLNEIGKLEKTEIDNPGKMIFQELYFKYLLIGVIGLLFMELFQRIVLKEVA